MILDAERSVESQLYNRMSKESSRNEPEEERTQLSNSGRIFTSLAAGGIAGGLAKTVIAPLDRCEVSYPRLEELRLNLSTLQIQDILPDQRDSQLQVQVRHQVAPSWLQDGGTPLSLERKHRHARQDCPLLRHQLHVVRAVQETAESGGARQTWLLQVSPPQLTVSAV